MNVTVWVLVIAGLWLAAPGWAAEPSGPGAQAPALPGQVLVRVPLEASPEALQEIADAVGAAVGQPLAPWGLYLFTFEETIPVSEMVARLQAQPAVLYAEPNYVLEAFLHQPEPGTDSLVVPGPRLAGTPAAGSGVVVAVLDTGLDLSHPAFTGRLYTNVGEIPGDGLDNDGNGYIDDLHGWDFYSRDSDPTPEGWRGGHGTEVAGRVLAGAGESPVRILPLRVGPGPGLSLAAIVEALAYAVAQGARVINMSFGAWWPSQALDDAVAYAAQHGAVLVAAAGNDGWNWPSYPAASPSVISVAASDDTGRWAWFSNYGETVDLLAPGLAVTTTAAGGGATTVNGTSFAAPFVAGAAARILAAEPAWTADQVFQQIVRVAAPVDGLNPGFHGLLGEGFLGAQEVQRLADALDPPAPPDAPSDPLNAALAQAEQEVARLQQTVTLAEAEAQQAREQEEQAALALAAAQAAVAARYAEMIRPLRDWRTDRVARRSRGPQAGLEALKRWVSAKAGYERALAETHRAEAQHRVATEAAHQAQERVAALQAELRAAQQRQASLAQQVTPSSFIPAAHQRELALLLQQLRAVHDAAASPRSVPSEPVFPELSQSPSRIGQ